MLENLLNPGELFFGWSGFLLGLIGALPIFGALIWRMRTRRDQIAADIDDLEQRFGRYREARANEIKTLNAALKEAEQARDRLQEIDPERFLDQLDALYDNARFDAAEELAEAFANRQSEAFGRAAELLAEQRLLDSETSPSAAEDALRFAQIGLAAQPGNKTLEKLTGVVRQRVRDVSEGAPLEALGMEGMTYPQLHALSHELRQQAKYELSELAARRCVPLTALHEGENSRNHLMAITVHAGSKSDLGDFEGAQTLLDHVIAVCEDSEALRPVLALALNDLGRIYQLQGRHAETEVMLRRGLQIDRELGQENTLSYAVRLQNLAQILIPLRRIDEAEELAQKSITIFEQLEGQNSARAAAALVVLSAIKIVQQEYLEAEALTLRALDIERQHLGEEHPIYARHLVDLGTALRKQGRLEDAINVTRQGVDIMARMLPAGHFSLSKAQQILTELLAELPQEGVGDAG